MFPITTKILLVEDSPSVAQGLMETLGQLKLSNVTFVSSVERALQVVQEKLDQNVVFDLIISDHHLPGKSGLEFLVDLKKFPEYVNVPYLTVTSDSRRENVLPYVSLGVSNFIVKPIKEDVLRDKLTSMWKALKK